MTALGTTLLLIRLHRCLCVCVCCVNVCVCAFEYGGEKGRGSEEYKEERLHCSVLEYAQLLVQCSTVQCSTVQYSTSYHSVSYDSAVLCSVVHSRVHTTQHNTTRFSSVQHISTNTLCSHSSSPLLSYHFLTFFSMEIDLQSPSHLIR